MHKIKTIELILVGDGPEKDSLQKKVEKYGLKENVIFTGGIYEPEKLGRYLLASSVYVLAGMGGISINDAMCFGKPIICSVCDGTEIKLVKECINGYYFKENNIKSLIDIILKMLSNIDKMEKMGKESIKIIAKEINVHTVIDKYLEAFNWVLKN